MAKNDVFNKYCVHAKNTGPNTEPRKNPQYIGLESDIPVQTNTKAADNPRNE